MQPQSAQAADGFEPKYRHFHPNSRIWVQNPFDHDIVFQVADEKNNPFQYTMPAHAISELPGGAIATLGVKRIVDELIQNNKDDEMRMWDKGVRKKHEDAIIVRYKETSPRNISPETGVIDLSVKGGDMEEIATVEAPKEEEAFPGLNEGAKPKLAPLPEAVSKELDNIALNSLPAKDKVLDA